MPLLHNLNLLACSCLWTVLYSKGSLADTSNQGSPIDYAPSINIQCPDLSTTPILRTWTPETQSVHPKEEEYVRTRAQNILPSAWRDWLGDGSRMGYNLDSFNGSWPIVGIAASGGGLRAAQLGAGVLNALDARNDTAKAIGTGGLLQVASYFSGVSGGSWLLGSLYFSNFPTIPELVFGNGNDRDGWKFDFPFAAPDGNNLLSEKNQYFYGSITWSIQAKAKKGLDTSITDPWARMIAYHFLNQTTRENFYSNETAHGAGQLWSRMPDFPAYQELLLPFPFVTIDSRAVGENSSINLESPVYEVSPFEFASYDPSLSAAVNLTYVGTHLTNGKPVNGSSCVTGFDQACFIMGSSASLFGTVFDIAQDAVNGIDNSIGVGLFYSLSKLLSSVRTRADDVANWPNPFKGINSGKYRDAGEDWLELLDGGTNGETIPYNPLLLKSRGVDVIITFDASDDTDDTFPAGVSLLATARRGEQVLEQTHQPFPPIPKSTDEFISFGVNARPTIFGCDPATPSDYPLVIYIPNSPPISGADPVTNTPTFLSVYTLKHTQLFIDQAFNLTTLGFTPNANIPDPNFPTCLQCAVFDRARMKADPMLARSQQCNDCFRQYCFDPQNPPSKSELPNRKAAFVDPDPQGALNFFAKNKFKFIGGLIGLVVLIALLIGGLVWWRKRRERRHYKKLSAIYGVEDAFLIPTSWDGKLKFNRMSASSSSSRDDRPRFSNLLSPGFKRHSRIDNGSSSSWYSDSNTEEKTESWYFLGSGLKAEPFKLHSTRGQS